MQANPIETKGITAGDGVCDARNRWLLLLVAVVLLSRIPFLGAGFGLHWDAWGNARIAAEIAETGRYAMARPPGAPLYELSIALLSGGGAWALNGFSALAGGAAVWIFALLCRQRGCRDWLLAAAALGFCTVMFVSSVTAKDFTLACAFVLLSALFVAKDRAVLAGVALGLAMACRPTNGAIALPLALILFARARSEVRIRQLTFFALTSALVVLIAFIPAFARYGVSFLTFIEPINYPPWQVVLRRGTVDVWGPIGCVGLLAASVGAIIPHRAATSIPPLGGRDTVAWISAVLIYGVLYVAFPDQAAYFLPGLPFLILLIARFSPRWLFQLFCAATIVGSVVGWQNGRPSAGPIFRDRAERLRTIESIRNFYDFAETVEGRNVFVIGAYYHALGVIAPESKHGKYVYLLPPKELAESLAAGYSIYYLPGIREFEHHVHGIDLAQYGAKDLYSIFEAKRAEAPRPTGQ